KRGRRAASARERDVVVPRRSKQHAITRVEIVRDDAQRASEPRETVGDAAPQEELLEEPFEGVEREQAGGQRVVEPIELLPKVFGRWGSRREGVHAVSKRAERCDDGAAPFIEVHAREVRALERKVIVGGIEKGAVQPLDG